ncbi:MAG: glutamine--fructose-6-phosphate transaminase (isomerizing) [Acidimicrobiia bacterium]|nr:glutamine--fructose-6-phosphate transaminase (isomerizing) [Acidimicrobiia bacterium]
MCGIVGYVGERPAIGVLVEGLRRLEYRGYDSAGVAVVDETGTLRIVRRKGKLADLEAAPELADTLGTTGIGHTRWATHGVPSERNCHPHVDARRQVAVVHNGIIENFHDLRSALEDDGVDFASDTDSEVVAQLIGAELAATPEADLADAVRAVCGVLEGAFAIAVVGAGSPGRIVGARRNAPLVAGLTGSGGVLASDIPAVIAETRDVVILEDDEVVDIDADSLVVTDLAGRRKSVETVHVDWDVDAAERGGFEDFMLKEIHEQPRALSDTLRGRIDPYSGHLHLDELRTSDDELRAADKVFVVACGTSFHAGLVAKYAIEHWVRIPVEIDIASEFRYRDPVLDGRTLVVGVSQSGETADTIAACRYARQLGAKVVTVTNVVGSSMAREADAVVYTHAGPEVGVAATKTFTCQIAALLVLSLYLAQVRGGLYPSEVKEVLSRMHLLPAQVATVLDATDPIRAEAARWSEVTDAFYLGRGPAFPTALEGALKMKEISYLHAEAYPSGELKHGPLALIEPGVPVLSVVTAGRVQGKTISNVAEVEARGGRIVLVANPGADLGGLRPHVVFEVPETHELLAPIVDSVVLQLLAYFVAKQRGCDVDRPRNLAKTVTVE